MVDKSFAFKFEEESIDLQLERHLEMDRFLNNESNFSKADGALFRYGVVYFL